MDRGTLERLAVAYVRRRTFESHILAVQVVSELGLSMIDPQKPTPDGTKTKPPANKISGAEMLSMMGVSVPK